RWVQWAAKGGPVSTATSKRPARPASAAPPETAADRPDLIARLGGIDPARVWLNPPPGRATEADMLRAVERKVGRCELVDQTLVEKPLMGVEDNYLAARLISLLNDFVLPRRLGAVVSSQAPSRMSEGNVRLPDVGFFSASQWRAWRRR